MAEGEFARGRGIHVEVECYGDATIDEAGVADSIERGDLNVELINQHLTESARVRDPDAATPTAGSIVEAIICDGLDLVEVLARLGGLPCVRRRLLEQAKWHGNGLLCDLLTEMAAAACAPETKGGV